MARSLRQRELLASAARTNTAVVFTSEVDVSSYTEARLLIDVSDSSGTNPRLTIVLNMKYEEGGSAVWYHAGTVVHAMVLDTADGTTHVSRAYPIKNLGKKLRVGYYLEGTTPSATFSLRLTSKD